MKSQTSAFASPETRWLTFLRNILNWLKEKEQKLGPWDHSVKIEMTVDYGLDCFKPPEQVVADSFIWETPQYEHTSASKVQDGG